MRIPALVLSLAAIFLFQALPAQAQFREGDAEYMKRIDEELRRAADEDDRNYRNDSPILGDERLQNEDLKRFFEETEKEFEGVFENNREAKEQEDLKNAIELGNKLAELGLINLPLEILEEKIGEVLSSSYEVVSQNPYNLVLWRDPDSFQSYQTQVGFTLWHFFVISKVNSSGTSDQFSCRSSSLLAKNVLSKVPAFVGNVTCYKVDVKASSDMISFAYFIEEPRLQRVLPY